MIPSILALSPTLARAAARSTGPANISAAAQQWAARPAEERYWSLADAAAASRSMDARRTLADLDPKRATIGTDADGHPALLHRASGHTARLDPLAVEQISRLVGAPGGYITSLPGELAAKCLAQGWESRAASGLPTIRAQVVDASTPSVRIRAITSTTHDLTPNSLLLARLAEIQAQGRGWRVPPARVPSGWTGETKVATEADCLQHAGHPALSVTPGSVMAPSGVYASDRDCFALLVDDSDSGQLDAGGDPLHRFVMISNSETATGALAVTTGWLRSVCGNHVLWSAQNIIDIRAVHRGASATRSVFRLAGQIEARNWMDDRSETAAAFAAAKVCELAKTKDDLIAMLFAKKLMTRERATACANVAEELESIDGGPRTAWGVAQAATRLSQVSSYASERHELDAAGAKILALAAKG